MPTKRGKMAHSVRAERVCVIDRVATYIGVEIQIPTAKQQGILGANLPKDGS